MTRRPDEEVIPEHSCLEHLEYRQQDFAENMDCEVDGAIDRWTEVWWECSVCKERFTEKEVEALSNETQQEDTGR